MGIIVIVILTLLVLYGIGNAFTYYLQDYLIFRPTHLHVDYAYKFNIPFQELNFEMDDGGTINALWFHREGEKRPLVYYHHGNSGDLTRWGKLSDYFDTLGYDLFIYDFRGFGKSKGSRNEDVFYSDGQTLMNFTLKHYAGKDIVLFGRSMGSGVASKLASDNEVRMLILETPYYSIRKLFASYYPFLPTFMFVFKYNFPVHEWLDTVRCPVQIFHGTRDYMVPYRCAKELKSHLKSDSHFLTISGAAHGNLSEYKEYTSRMQELLQN